MAVAPVACMRRYLINYVKSVRLRRPGPARPSKHMYSSQPYERSRH